MSCSNKSPKIGRKYTSAANINITVMEMCKFTNLPSIQEDRPWSGRRDLRSKIWLVLNLTKFTKCT